MNLVEAFFRDIDAAVAGARYPRFELRIVGSTELFLQTSYRRGTKDSDAVETYDFDPALREHLLGIAGRNTSIAIRHAIYLEFVGQGILFLPDEPVWTPWLTLEHFDLVVLDPTDIVVAKLVRLHGDDLRDIEAMVEQGIVSHERVVERFQRAVIQHGTYGRSDKLRPAIRNLHRAERDVFMVDEADIEIPAWMDA